MYIKFLCRRPQSFPFKSNICVLRGVDFNETHSAGLRITRAGYTAIKNISDLIKKPLLKSVRRAIWRKNRKRERRLGGCGGGGRGTEERQPGGRLCEETKKNTGISRIWTDITLYNEYARCWLVADHPASDARWDELGRRARSRCCRAFYNCHLTRACLF